MMNISTLEAQGYHRFEDQFKKDARVQKDPYKGTWQKCFRDHLGKKYFINIEMWDFQDSDFAYKNLAKEPSYQAHAQFESKDGTFNVELLSVQNKTLKEVEAWFEKQWSQNECFYYEKHEENTVS
jgi:hypothetical protein